jgi:prolyl-tRNA synthetase
MIMQEKKQTLGISAKKDEDFSEWYTQVIQKAELADYTPVSGCIVFRPNSYAMWEKIQSFLDTKFKKSGVKNAYFPLLIPESLLTREKEHVEGFTPEVAWVTRAGDTELAEKLAVRPTSETIMYDSYAKWIRSHNDLPLRINQWNSVLRWEFKHAVPFLRTREFLWQEGHSVFATQNAADAEAREILDYYTQTFEEMLAVPIVKGTKTEKEKFAGALYSLACETFLPMGKSIQAATSHCLGQNFSKAFNITFQDKNKETQFGWQNSWGFTTRSIGIMIIMHGDDKGLVVPPNVAPVQIAIVPILFEDSKKDVLKKAKELKRALKKHAVILDDREGYSPGFKFNEWELKGVPIRIEIGPRDLANNQVTVVRRDTGVKEQIILTDVKTRIPVLLEDIQAHLFLKAKKRIDDSIIDVNTWEEFKKAESEKRWIRASHCGQKDCEQKIKDETDGVKSNCIPFDQPGELGKCVKCDQPAKYKVMWSKSY